MLVDTHAHLASPSLSSDLEEVVRRATAAEVTRIVTIGTDLEDCRRCLEIAERYDGVYAAVGIHPTSVTEIEADDWLDQIREMAGHEKVVAIGEIGLDYFHPPGDGSSIADYRRKQAEFCAAQLELAAELGMNAVIHQRECLDDAIDIVAPFSDRLRAVFHCFTGTPRQAQRVLDLGHLVSFTGIVTFKSARDLQETAASVPAGRFMVETDAPYLAPSPHRGKRCEPAFTRQTAERIAQLRGATLETLAAQTTGTAEAFFQLPPPKKGPPARSTAL